MTKLIEDMAKAITRGPHSVWPWKDYVPAAERALAVVLASLREPSEGMITEGVGWSDEDTDERWKAMLSQWEKEQG